MSLNKTGSVNHVFWIVGLLVIIFVAVGIFLWILGPSKQFQTVSETPGIFNKYGLSSKAIVWNGVTLNDSTEFDEKTNVCTAFRNGMKIEVSPCVAGTMTGKNIHQTVNFTWLGKTPQETSWIFIYDGEIEAGGIDVLQNASFSEMQQVQVNRVVTNYGIYNVTNFLNLGQPIEPLCQFGNANNTQMYNVTRNNNGTVFTDTFCFNSATPNGEGSYLISGNYWGNEQQLVSGYKNQWIDATSSIEFMGSNLLNQNRSYYKTQDVMFQPNQSIMTRWRYTPEGNATQGKWHIFGKRSSDPLEESILNDAYIYMDPAWTASMSVGIQAYLNMDDAIDKTLHGHNLTLTTSSVGNVGGIIGDMFTSPGAVTNFSNASGFTFNSTRGTTVNWWVKTSTSTAGSYTDMWRITVPGGQWRIMQWTTNKVYSDQSGVGCSANTGIECTNCGLINTNQWIMMTLRINATGYSIWQNGTQKYSEALTGCNNYGETANLAHEGGGRLWIGNIDEFGFWDRDLTNSEISDLWNGGAGITYEQQNAEVNQTIISPAPSGVVLNYTDIIFNATTNSTGSGQNISLMALYVDGAGICSVGPLLDTQYYNLQCESTVTEGSHTFFQRATLDNGSNVDSSQSYNFSVDLTPPVVTITYPGIVPYHQIGQNLSINWTYVESNPDTCWIEFNNLNRTVICLDKNVSLNMSSYDNKTIRFYMNDTVGNQNYIDHSWNYGLFVNKTNYNPQSLILQSETLSLEGYYIDQSHTLTFKLRYNNTDYSSIVSTSGQSIIITNTLTTPTVATAINQTFYWDVKISNSTTTYMFNTTRLNQTVYSLTIDNCASGTVKLYNITIYDEDTLGILHPTNDNTTIEIDLALSTLDDSQEITYSNNFTRKNAVGICLDRQLFNSTIFKTDAIIKYYADNYVSEYYSIQNGTTTNSTLNQNISLYDLLTTNSQEFLITVKDSNFVPLEDAVVTISRQYIPEGLFRTVEAPLTDADGRTIAHFILNDQVYTIYVRQQGKLIATYQNVRTFCSDVTTGNCQINLNALSTTVTPNSFINYLGVEGLKNYNSTTGIFTFSFTDINSQAREVLLNISKYDAYINQSVCSSTLTAQAGTLTCSIPSAYRNQTLVARIYIDEVLYSTDIFNSGALSISERGYLTYFLAFLLIMTIPLLGISSGPMTIIMFIVGVVMAGAMFLIDTGGVVGSFSVVLWIVLAGGVLLFKATRRNQ